MSLTILCQELKNWFCREADKHSGSFQIVDGKVALPFLTDGQYFRIKGSVFNDGVHCYSSNYIHSLAPETFDGEVWAMRVPQEVVDLSERIDRWQTANQKALESPFQSEGWNGYSYSLKSGGLSGGAITWQSQFSNELRRWRKV